MQYYAEYISPMGNLLLTSDGEALTGLWIGRDAPEDTVSLDTLSALQKVGVWLDAYFRGEPREIDFPLAAGERPFRSWSGNCCYRYHTEKPPPTVLLPGK